MRVVVNDRGPFVQGRILDLSRKAARRIDLVDDGVTAVDLKIIRCHRGYTRCKEKLDTMGSDIISP